jgi:hypothetical protein
MKINIKDLREGMYVKNDVVIPPRQILITKQHKIVPQTLAKIRSIES